jgi:hypothetical protein
VKSAIHENLDPADRAYGGLKKINVPPAYNLFPLENDDLSHLFVCVLHFAEYRSMSKRNLFVRDVFTCLYRFKCGCYCALSVKT